MSHVILAVDVTAGVVGYALAMRAQIRMRRACRCEYCVSDAGK